MIRRIPLRRTLSTFERYQTLDGVEYLLKFTWNSRASVWFFSVYSSEGTPLAVGRKLTTDRPLLIRDVDSRLPPGDLWLIDTEGEGLDPTLRDLGQRSQLFYVEAE